MDKNQRDGMVEFLKDRISKLRDELFDFSLLAICAGGGPTADEFELKARTAALGLATMGETANYVTYLGELREEGFDIRNEPFLRVGNLVLQIEGLEKLIAILEGGNDAAV